MLDAAAKNAFLALVNPDDRRRCEKALEDLALALTEKKIYNVQLQDLKTDLDRSVDRAYDYGSGLGRPSREEMYGAGYEPTELGKLTNIINFHYVRDAIAASKRLAKTKVSHRWVATARDFAAAVLPVAMALEAVKPFIVKGRRPVEKAPVERTGREGTCPCCFGEYQTHNGLLVNHGFERPGVGYLIGKCFGVSHKRFEDSPEGTKLWIAVLDGMLANNLRTQKAFAEGKILSIPFSYETAQLDDNGNPVRDMYGRRLSQTRTEVVLKGAKAVLVGKRLVPAFVELAKVEVANLESTERSLKGDIDHLQGLVKTWTPGWKRPVGW